MENAFNSSPSNPSTYTLKGARWLVWYLGERKNLIGEPPILSEWQESMASAAASNASFINTPEGARWLVWYLGERNKSPDGAPILSEFQESMAAEVAWAGLDELGRQHEAF